MTVNQCHTPISAVFGNYASRCFLLSKRACVVVALKLNEIANDLEASQKAFAVAMSFFQGLNIYRSKSSLPELINSFDILQQTLDFFGFLRLPRFFRYPYTPERIDEYALLNNVEKRLCRNWNLKSNGQAKDPVVRYFAKKQIQAFLEQMVENDRDFKNETDLRQNLSQWLKQALLEKPRANLDPHRLNLEKLKVPLKKQSWLKKGEEGLFVFVDIAYVPFFLGEWGFIDLSLCLQKVGRVRAFRWVLKQDFEDWIRTAMCAGFLLRFLQAAQVLSKADSKPSEVKAARWQIAASLTEFVFNFAMLQKRNPALIVALTFVTKSIGLLQFFCSPKPIFFEKHAVAPAA